MTLKHTLFYRKVRIASNLPLLIFTALTLCVVAASVPSEQLLLRQKGAQIKESLNQNTLLRGGGIGNNGNNVKSPSSFNRTGHCCQYFVWDGLSACRYHICKRLLRDNIYEGMGGKKFVRIRPGSMLESLYPLSQHGPDRCMVCGMSFRDHLLTWWFPRLYTPYDLHLESIRKEAQEDKENVQSRSRSSKSTNGNKRRRRSKQSKNTSYVENGMIPHTHHQASSSHQNQSLPLMYHKRYVEEVSLQSSQLKQTISEKKRQQNRKLSPTKNRKPKQNADGQQLIDDSEKRKIGKMNYLVPKFKPLQSHEPASVKTVFQAIVREMVLVDFDVYLCLQEMENRLNDWKRKREISMRL